MTASIMKMSDEKVCNGSETERVKKILWIGDAEDTAFESLLTTWSASRYSANAELVLSARGCRKVQKIGNVWFVPQPETEFGLANLVMESYVVLVSARYDETLCRLAEKHEKPLIELQKMSANEIRNLLSGLLD